jgi:hypothetical protein
MQKTDVASLEFHTYNSRRRNSHTFVYTSQRLDMWSTIHVADVETMIPSRPKLCAECS